ncbi:POLYGALACTURONASE 3 [Hibiscus trionum]|uniref:POLYGALACTURONASE 3 n=1 Tax=Hibiscus trionum TaxID=183268 RepID=A0A9W7I2L1_HIBTR|nr:POLYGALACTURONASE 3 [Hibiscus trionum]
MQVTYGGAGDSSVSENPFTPKASFIRYWNKQLHSQVPSFLLSKVSPLTAVDSATFAKLATQNNLDSSLSSFCSSAKLFCFPDLSPGPDKDWGDVDFARYGNKSFVSYGSNSPWGVNSFKNYSDNGNVVGNSFRRYSRDSEDHKDQFSTYAGGSNVVDQSFNNYGALSKGGSGTFNSYNDEVNVPNLRFKSYSDRSKWHGHTFASYAKDANSGKQQFINYGKEGDWVRTDFSSYANGSNVVNSGFYSYGKKAGGADDTFTSYALDSNDPVTGFASYGRSGNSSVDSFSNYQGQGDSNWSPFKSYDKNSKWSKADFSNYWKSWNEGAEDFTGYGLGAEDPSIEFKSYVENTTFKDYAKKGITFSKYNQSLNSNGTDQVNAGRRGVNKWVEPGKFFREKMLKQGTVMPMPDIKDNLPARSFLPRIILYKLPFSSSKIGELKRIFHAGDNSSLESIMLDALDDCERAPSPGETKRCVGSAEDMLDFASSVLGRNVVVRTTENVNGSKTNITIGAIRKINGGNVTKSVSCHQSLYPYLLYYCHSVPKVRVYEADILDPNSMEKINHGVAICHLDTSDWSPGHGAFLALGSAPGQIEVCHWIFENDMTWTIADAF